MYPYRRKRRGLRIAISVLVALLLIAGTGSANYLRPLPPASASTAPLTSEINAVHLNWPLNSQTAIGAVGFGALGTHGPQSPLPVASLAKVITALAILQKRPLKAGQQGPSIMLGDDDVAIYNKYLKENGAAVKVASGEQITEYQMLQAMFLASANNIADSAAIWAFGSLGRYADYANAMVRSFDLNDTTVGGDASGFLPDTTSTANDLTKLGMRALQQPVLTQIIAQHQAELPVVVLIVIVLAAMYNGLVRLNVRAEEAWSDITVQLKRRYDLIPNLVNTVKGYATHEKSVFEDVTKARTQAMGAQGVEETAKAENQFASTLKSLFAVAENYPQLKANENFKALQDELTDTEDKIMASRRFYNSMVMSFNTKRKVFPTNVFANMLGFKQDKPFFELDEAAQAQAQEPVQVKF